MIRKPSLFAAGVAIALCGVAATAAHARPTAYAIANGGTTLVSFDVANPGAVTTVGNFNGAASFLDGMDFRPLNGQLYGYLDSTDSLYTVNLATATLTQVASSTGASATNTFNLGLDFNPQLDRLRVVTDSDQDLVYNPNGTGPASVGADLHYSVADVNANADPNVIDVAYSNNIIGTGLTTTMQYGIDYGTDSLVTLANDGTLNTIGSLGIDTDTYTGFDIFTSLSGVNSAYAVLDGPSGDAPSLYSINLATGAATSVGAVGEGLTQVYGLAVAPVAAVVPEASTVGLMLGGIAAAGASFLMCKRRLSRA